MAMKIKLQPTQMATWAPGTQHYRATDGTNLAVESSIASLDGEIDIPRVAGAVNELMKVVVGTSMPVRQVVRPTVVFTCSDEGLAIDMTPLRKFPPGISHEAALKEMGYKVTL